MNFETKIEDIRTCEDLHRFQIELCNLELPIQEFDSVMELATNQYSKHNGLIPKQSQEEIEKEIIKIKILLKYVKKNISQENGVKKDLNKYYLIII